jgi:hypothetical protein
MVEQSSLLNWSCGPYDLQTKVMVEQTLNQVGPVLLRLYKHRQWLNYTKSPPSLMIAPILSDFFMRFRE